MFSTWLLWLFHRCYVSPSFLTISYRFPWCFHTFPLLFLRFPRVFLLFPLSVFPVSYFRLCDLQLIHQVSTIRLLQSGFKTIIQLLLFHFFYIPGFSKFFKDCWRLLTEKLTRFDILIFNSTGWLLFCKSSQVLIYDIKVE